MPGVIQIDGGVLVVGVSIDRVVGGLSGLPGMVSRRAPAVLGGGCNCIFVCNDLGNDLGGMNPSLGGGSGGAGGFLIIQAEA